MVYITGDTHTSANFNKLYFDDAKNLTKNDYVIVAGDFELIWSNSDGEEWIDRLNKMPFTTLFIDGNYDNYAKLKKLQTIQKFGGNVGVVSDSVYWLKRGEIYEIDGHTYMTIGGATSINKSDRVEGVDWWADEELSEADMEYILANGEKQGEVDFIITHTCPTSILGAIKEYALKDNVSEFLEEIFYMVGFNKWFFGHMHCDTVVHDNFFAVYENVLKVEKGEKRDELESVLLLN